MMSENEKNTVALVEAANRADSVGLRGATQKQIDCIVALLREAGRTSDSVGFCGGAMGRTEILTTSRASKIISSLGGPRRSARPRSSGCGDEAKKLRLWG